MKQQKLKRLFAITLTACIITGTITGNAGLIWAADTEYQMQEEIQNTEQKEEEGQTETPVSEAMEADSEDNASEPEMAESPSAEETEAEVTADETTAEEENTEVDFDETTAEEREAEVISDETADEQETELSDEGLLANSWRFQDGELINSEQMERAATYPNAWNKENGHYVNSRGEIIPGAVKKGIDVSFWNGTINWEQVKADGIDFAIIRCGYGMDDKSQDDTQWARNVAECERLGIPYGVYLYSYADTVERARSEAQHVLRLLKNHTPSYPVYYDLEDKNVEKVSAGLKGQIAKTFCDTVAASGYQVGIYSNLNWWNNYLTDPVFQNESWSKWVAQYNYTCDYKGRYDIWQCTSTGKVKGISGNSGNVDINFLMDTATIPGASDKKPTLEYDSASGNWCTFKDGKIDTTYVGVIENEYGWWYVKNGYLDWNYTGVAQNEYGWWYIRNGALDWSYTGVAPNEYGWWYIRNGALDLSYTGVAQNENGWWYVKNGYLDWNYTGVAQNEYGWWYIRNGALDWNYTGVAANEYGWWYITNGWLNWGYTGVGENEYGWWYIRNGSLDWGYSGNVGYKGRNYRVQNGIVMH